MTLAKAPPWVRPAAMAGLGLLIGAAVVRSLDLASVAAAVRPIGLAGFGAAIAMQLAMSVPLGLAWRLAAVGVPGRRAPAFVWSSLVSEAASAILPFSQLGGAVIATRAAVLGGVSAGAALGSNVVDITLELAAQLVYTLAGVAILAGRLSWAPQGHPLLWTALGGLVAGAALFGGLVLAQTRGLWMVEGVARRMAPAAGRPAAAVVRAVEAIHGRPLRLWACFGLHLGAWFATSVTTWLILALMRRPLPLLSVVALESLVFAIRNAAFMVPGALGVQEGAFALLGPLFGLPAEAGLALALLKRARDITLGVPVLLSWQAAEWRRPSRARAPPAGRQA